jgi:glycerophosphoryl diester phosphodiesterase
VEAYCKAKGINPPFYNIETKSTPATDGQYHPAPAEFVDLVMSIVRYKLIDRRVIIQSFDDRTLQYLHQKYPSVKTALLIEFEDGRSLDTQLKDLGFTPTIYSPAYALVTPALIEQCKKLNLQVIPWTINNEAQMKLMKALGVDGLITDYPNIKF